MRQETHCTSFCCLPRSEYRSARQIHSGDLQSASNQMDHFEGNRKQAVAAAVTMSALFFVQRWWSRWRKSGRISSQHDSLDGISKFIATSFHCLRDTISDLVEIAGPAHGVAVHYYSSPRGPGTSELVENYNDENYNYDSASSGFSSIPSESIVAHDFLLLASTNSVLDVGSAPPPEFLPAIAAALRGDDAEVDSHLVIGVLSDARDGIGILIFEGDKSMSPDEIAYLRTAVKAWVGILTGRIERVRQMALLNENRIMVKLWSIGAEMAKENSISGIMNLTHGPVADIMNVEKMTLWFLDESRDEIWTPKTHDLPKGIKLKFGVGLVGHVARRARKTRDFDKSLLCTNAPQKCPLWKGDVKADFNTRTLLSVPILAKHDQHLLGVVQLVNKRSRGELEDGIGFNEMDIRLSGVLAQILGQELERLLIAKIAAKIQLDGSRDKRGSGISLFTEFYEDGALLKSKKHSGSDRRISTDLDQVVSIDDKLHIDNWEIDYWNLAENSEFALLVRSLATTHSMEVANIPQETLYRFFKKVKGAYNANPYHNFHHAMSTIHYSYKLAMATDMETQINKLDMFALLVGSLCHDIDHRGKNAMYEISTRSELALRYNDCSPLENHHCARSFEIAFSSDDKSANIFGNMSEDDYKAIRHTMVACILSTDMKHHGDHVKKAQKFDPAAANEEEELSKFLVELLMHAADIANPIMPPKISARWNNVLCEEFTLQVQAEREHGLPITPFMDGLTTPHGKAKSALGFIDFVAFPLMDPLFRAFPGWANPRNWMIENRDHHAKVIEDVKREDEAAGFGTRDSIA